MKKSVLVQLLLATVLIVSGYAQTSEIQINQSRTYIASNGAYIELPLGELSFTDKVVSFDKKEPANSYNSDPSKALGAPDTKTLSLSCGGTAVFEFTDNTLLDVEGNDLYIFSYNSNIDPTAVAISIDGQKWIELGEVSGSTVAVDIKLFVQEGETFSYVRLTDLKKGCDSTFPGADIDAIAAVGSGVKVSLSSTILLIV